jgi:NADPH:quinone reductase-like Zn-dependent oxidoreductase
MKAIIIRENTDWKTVQLEETKIPVIKPTQVLVKIKASGINVIDWKAPQHHLFDLFKIKLPYIVGNEISGIIQQIGERVQNFKSGDEIFGALKLSTQGGFAEYVSIDENSIARKPQNLSFVEAAAIPVAGLTAWQALYDKLNLQTNQKILIQAAAGGVGNFAVQLAKLKGAYVVAVASEKNTEFLKYLGADEVFNYANDFSILPRNFDGVLDSMDSSEQTIPLLKTGGRYVSITGPAADEIVKRFEVHATNFLYEPNATQLDNIRELIETNKLKVVIDKTFALSEASDALRYQEASHTRGKNILKVDPD